MSASLLGNRFLDLKVWAATLAPFAPRVLVAGGLQSGRATVCTVGGPVGLCPSSGSLSGMPRTTTTLIVISAQVAIGGAFVQLFMFHRMLTLPWNTTEHLWEIGTRTVKLQLNPLAY